jgi:peptidoglycan/xylan/chitin deacetylase (PgdA/CDA1 family)
VNSPAIPILMYHLVAPRPPAGFVKYTVTPKAFSAQMSWLRIAGYHPVTIDDWLQYRRDGSGMPSRPVIITFDDGFQDCFTYALPILRTYRYPAIFFVVAGLVGQTSQWVGKPELNLRLMDWDMVIRLRELGFECGSHTISHPHLPDLSVEDCRRELSYSRYLLEERLSRPVRHLAYPWGSYNEVVRGLAESVGYASASTTQIGISMTSDDPMTLRRVPVIGRESLLDFACRLFCASSPQEWLPWGLKHLYRSLKAARSAWTI